MRKIVLYYKEQEQSDADNENNLVDDDDGNSTNEEDENSLDDDEGNSEGQEGKDLILIIANDFQLDMLKKFGHDIVCIDSTHGTNMYDFHLTSLVVVDEFGNGIPVAFCISNKKNSATWTIFFSKLRDRVGVLESKVFMSDIDHSFYKAWKRVMKPVSRRLFCTWHVDKAWRKYLQKKIKDTEKRVSVYKSLRVLLQETDIDKFHVLLNGFREIYQVDAETKDFVSYFVKSYSKNFEEWAYCY